MLACSSRDTFFRLTYQPALFWIMRTNILGWDVANTDNYITENSCWWLQKAPCVSGHPSGNRTMPRMHYRVAGTTEAECAGNQKVIFRFYLFLFFRLFSRILLAVNAFYRLVWIIGEQHGQIFIIFFSIYLLCHLAVGKHLITCRRTDEDWQNNRPASQPVGHDADR